MVCFLILQAELGDDPTLVASNALLLISAVSSGIHQSQTSLLLLFQKGSVYFLEGGALFCVPPPAAQHHLVERVWTQLRLGQVDLAGTEE